VLPDSYFCICGKDTPTNSASLSWVSDEEKKIFCRMVYLLRKRGYSIPDAQIVAYRQVLEESIPFHAGK